MGDNENIKFQRFMHAMALLGTLLAGALMVYFAYWQNAGAAGVFGILTGIGLASMAPRGEMAELANLRKESEDLRKDLTEANIAVCDLASKLSLFLSECLVSAPHRSARIRGYIWDVDYMDFGGRIIKSDTIAANSEQEAIGLALCFPSYSAYIHPIPRVTWRLAPNEPPEATNDTSPR